MIAAVFMFLCLLPLSSLAVRNHDQASLNENVLKSEIRHITAQSILTPVNDQVAVHFFKVPASQRNLNDNNYSDLESRLIHHHLRTLAKSRETVTPLHIYCCYPKAVPANKDDLPDLS